MKNDANKQVNCRNIPLKKILFRDKGLQSKEPFKAFYYRCNKSFKIDSNIALSSILSKLSISEYVFCTVKPSREQPLCIHTLCIHTLCIHNIECSAQHLRCVSTLLNLPNAMRPLFVRLQCVLDIFSSFHFVVTYSYTRLRLMKVAATKRSSCPSPSSNPSLYRNSSKPVQRFNCESVKDRQKYRDTFEFIIYFQRSMVLFFSLKQKMYTSQMYLRLL